MSKKDWTRPADGSREVQKSFSKTPLKVPDTSKSTEPEDKGDKNGD